MGKVPAIVNKVRNSKVEVPEGAVKLSYSQLSTYLNCTHAWKLKYLDKIPTYRPSIHTTFGTALHETFQHWLTVMYEGSIKKANELDIKQLLYTNLVNTFSKEVDSNGGSKFSSPEELRSFYSDGLNIMEFVRKKRVKYFTTKKVHLAGIETELNVKLAEGVYFKGFIDVVFYDEDLDKWLLLDIKTSTSGWNSYVKKDDNKIAQLLLYKEFFAKQFNIDLNKIDIEYFIVKRKVPEDPEYPAMASRVQQFRPASGPIKRGQATQKVQKFLKEAIDQEGKLIKKSYTKSLTMSACRFCDFKNTDYCPESKNVN